VRYKHDLAGAEDGKSARTLELLEPLEDHHCEDEESEDHLRNEESPG
jgi:hypothetical protein